MHSPIVIAALVRGKLPRTTGWQPVLPRTHASSRRFEIRSRRSNVDRAQVTLRRSRNGCFSVRENISLPPAAINLLEWERFDSFYDVADRRGSERNEIWITPKKAHVTAILHDGNDVACEQGAFAISTHRPMQHGASFEMTSEIDQRQLIPK